MTHCCVANGSEMIPIATGSDEVLIGPHETPIRSYFNFHEKLAKCEIKYDVRIVLDEV